jgi:hypothetical protein
MEAAGIDMLPPEAGIPAIRRELTVGGTRGEIVVAQRLGVLLKEFDASGGLDTTRVNAGADLISGPSVSAQPLDSARGPMIGAVSGIGVHSGLTIETTLDPAAQPFLHDHQIDGTPVLPGVMGIEAFAETALWMLPGWHIQAIEDVDFLAPFKFYRGEPRTITIEAVFRPEGESVVADCRLLGRRQLANQPEPQITTHFTGRVRLTKNPAEAAAAPSVGEPGEAAVDSEAVYKVYFHGPAYQVVERAWLEGDRIVGRIASSLPANHLPAEQPTFAAPRLIELCFQTAGLLQMSAQGTMGLPQHVDRVCFGSLQDPAENGSYAVVTATEDHGSFGAEVGNAAGQLCLSLSGYRTVALPTPVNLEPLQVLQAVMA